MVSKLRSVGEIVESILHGGRLVECSRDPSTLGASTGAAGGLPIDEIDPAISNLVFRMNDITGVMTLWSCQGHWRSQLRPYLVFTAPSEVVYHVSEYLNRVNDLTYIWWIRGDWHHAQSRGFWRWTLEPNDWRLAQGGRHLLFRKALDRDFSLIGDAFCAAGDRMG